MTEIARRLVLPGFGMDSPPGLEEEKPTNRFVWAWVMSVDPLRIRLDGETETLPVLPDLLVNKAVLRVGTRVWVQHWGKRMMPVSRHWLLCAVPSTRLKAVRAWWRCSSSRMLPMRWSGY